MKDEKIQEIHERLQDEQERKQKSFLSKLTQKQKMFLVIAAVSVGFFYMSGNLTKQHLMFIGGAIVLIVIVSQQGKEDPFNYNVISMEDAHVMLYTKLRHMQNHPLGDHYRIPPGKIKIDIKSSLRYREIYPWYWETMFSIVSQNLLEKIYTARQNPKNGDILKIIERPKGFTGEEVKDVTYILSPRMRQEKKFYDSMGKYTKDFER